MISKPIRRRLYSLPFLARYRSHRAAKLAVSVHFREGFDLFTLPNVLRDEWELEERAVYARQLPLCDAFIDIGAHHGFYTVLAARHGKRVLSLEPDAGNYGILKRNTQSLNDVEIKNVALGDRRRHLTLHGDGDLASLRQEWTPDSGFRQRVQVEVLDRLVASLDGRLLIKIDVEGAEVAVLQGAAETLKRTAVWIIETMADMPSGVRDEHSKKVFRIMADYGYTASQIGSTYNWVFERSEISK